MPCFFSIPLVVVTPPSPLPPPLLSQRRRTKLGLARLFWLAFGVFFVLYHLCYENILHHTDGMEYLSDWTFVLLAIVMGLLAFHSLGKTPTSGGDASGGGDAHHERLAEFTVALHGVCWSSNIVSTAGAWYSFFFFPVCESLEGEEGGGDGWINVVPTTHTHGFLHRPRKT